MKIQEIKNKKINLIDLEIIIASVLKKDRSFLSAFPEYEFSTKEFNEISEKISRREKNEPLAYILGFKEFFGRKFFVNRNVLIPREETENMVELALKIAQEKKFTKIVDVGTGSGCIAITLALELPKNEIVATDISSPALAVAEKNAKFLKVDKRINFKKSNLLANLTEKFDLILANLPYIPNANWEKLPSEIKNFEPREALVSGKNPFTLYQKLFLQAKNKLNKKGVILYEVDGKIIQVSAAYLEGMAPEQKHLPS